jgi:hypothetical protein
MCTPHECVIIVAREVPLSNIQHPGVDGEHHSDDRLASRYPQQCHMKSAKVTIIRRCLYVIT